MAKKTVDQMADQMDISKTEAGGLMAKAKSINNMAGYMRGGHIYVVTYGSEDVPVEYGREKLKGRNDKELNIGASKPKMYHSSLSGRKKFLDPRLRDKQKTISDMDKYIKGNDGGNAKNTRVF